MNAPNQPDHSQTLNHIAEVSKNARAIWFSLIGLCLFVGVTLLGHKDADFFAYGAETHLPLVNVQIPVWSFFVSAAVLIAVLYVYLQYALSNLWDALADAPAQIDGKPLSEVIYPSVILRGALSYRSKKQGDDSYKLNVPNRADEVIWCFFVWWLGPAMTLWLWFHATATHEDQFSINILFLSFVIGVTGSQHYRSARSRLSGRAGQTARPTWIEIAVSMAVFLPAYVLSQWMTIGGFLPPSQDSAEVAFLLRSAELSGEDLTKRPAGMPSYEFWVKGFEHEYRQREGLPKSVDRKW